MQINDTALPGVKLLQLRVHHDTRGHFVEVWQSQRYQELLGAAAPFVQHNQSVSSGNVLRGMHYQRQHGQGKLIRVVQGCIWDVAVDLRPGSPAFGKWLGIELSGVDAAAPGQDHLQVWVPPGFAHGFLVLSQHAIVDYLCTDFYDPADEVCLRWDDPDVNIAWPHQQPELSPRDAKGLSLHELRNAGLLPGSSGAMI